MKELQITQEDIKECLPLKNKSRNAQGFQAVSYTHLDVYKRQVQIVWHHCSHHLLHQLWPASLSSSTQLHRQDCS